MHASREPCQQQVLQSFTLCGTPDLAHCTAGNQIFDSITPCCHLPPLPFLFAERTFTAIVLNTLGPLLSIHCLVQRLTFEDFVSAGADYEAAHDAIARQAEGAVSGRPASHTQAAPQGAPPIAPPQRPPGPVPPSMGAPFSGGYGGPPRPGMAPPAHSQGPPPAYAPQYSSGEIA